MLYPKLDRDDFGKLFFFFASAFRPDPKKFLPIGQTYKKSDYFPELYNKFPFDTVGKGINRFPQMTSNTAPAGYTAAASSTLNVQGSLYYHPGRAFNPSTSGATFYEHRAYHGMSNDGPSAGLMYRGTEPLYVCAYTIQIPPNSSTKYAAAPVTLSGNLEGINSEDKYTIIDKQTDVRFELNTTYTFGIRAGEAQMCTGLVGDFRKSSYPRFAIHYITVLTIDRDTYINGTNSGYIPAYETPQGCKGYIYIGPDNYSKMNL